MKWSSLDKSTFEEEVPETPQKDAKIRTKVVGNTYLDEDALDKSELMVKRPIRKSDLLGGRKMVFYQYRSELYNPNNTNFAGRRKSAKTSDYRGVYWNKNHRKWEVKIKIAGKTLSLGFFLQEEAAGRKYDKFITLFVINRLAINFPEEVGGTKLSLKELVTGEPDETLEEANDKAKEASKKKVQDLALDFGLDDPQLISEGCVDWPGK